MMRNVSQIDFHTATKLNQQAGIPSFNMLTPLPTTYQPQIMDECYSYSSSPEPNMGAFSQPREQNGFLASSRAMTPSTPEPFAYNEPIAIADPLVDPYMNNQSWSDDGSIPVGLGFENDMFSNDMWATPEPESTTPMGMCNSPSSMSVWSHPVMSVSPPHMQMSMPPHTKAMPSLSMSESSNEDFNSPNGVQEEWNAFQQQAAQNMARPMVTSSFMDNVKAYPKAPQPIWEDLIVPRTQGY